MHRSTTILPPAFVSRRPALARGALVAAAPPVDAALTAAPKRATAAKSFAPPVVKRNKQGRILRVEFLGKTVRFGIGLSNTAVQAGIQDHHWAFLGEITGTVKSLTALMLAERGVPLPDAYAKQIAFKLIERRDHCADGITAADRRFIARTEKRLGPIVCNHCKGSGVRGGL